MVEIFRPLAVSNLDRLSIARVSRFVRSMFFHVPCSNQLEVVVVLSERIREEHWLRIANNMISEDLLSLSRSSISEYRFEKKNRERVSEELFAPRSGRLFDSTLPISVCSMLSRAV